ncbi:MAG: hypothetical protein Q7R59_03170 [bacterium]|nr:hypothetical protein [bacterium]
MARYHDVEVLGMIFLVAGIVATVYLVVNMVWSGDTIGTIVAATYLTATMAILCVISTKGVPIIIFGFVLLILCAWVYAAARIVQDDGSTVYRPFLFFLLSAFPVIGALMHLLGRLYEEREKMFKKG